MKNKSDMGQKKKIRLPPQNCIHGWHSNSFVVTSVCPFSVRHCCWGGSATAISGPSPQFFPLHIPIPVLEAMTTKQPEHCYHLHSFPLSANKNTSCLSTFSRHSAVRKPRGNLSLRYSRTI